MATFPAASVVSLATGLQIDDHSEMAVPDVIDVPDLGEARTNLMRQAAILSLLPERPNERLVYTCSRAR